MRNCNVLLFFFIALESTVRRRGTCGNEEELELVESSPGQGAIYIHRADAASQIDENKELMPNLDGRGRSLDKLPARAVGAGIALL